MTLARRTILLTAIIALAGPALAHHGWRWTDGGDFELTGIITEVQLGNPHGVLTIDAEGEIWRAEIGQPHRNAAAGLRDDMLRAGTEITLLGERSADPAVRVMKAERVTIGGTGYDLYPDRL
jgi:Family of unknown function (DUF6152)